MILLKPGMFLSLLNINQHIMVVLYLWYCQGFPGRRNCASLTQIDKGGTLKKNSLHPTGRSTNLTVFDNYCLLHMKCILLHINPTNLCFFDRYFINRDDFFELGELCFSLVHCCCLRFNRQVSELVFRPACFFAGKYVSHWRVCVWPVWVRPGVS